MHIPSLIGVFQPLDDQVASAKPAIHERQRVRRQVSMVGGCFPICSALPELQRRPRVWLVGNPGVTRSVSIVAGRR